MMFFHHLPMSRFRVINKQNNEYTLFSLIAVKYSVTCATNLGRQQRYFIRGILAGSIKG